MKKCKVLFKAEINKTTYVIYTNDKKNECGDVIAYAATVDKGKIIPVDDEEILEFLDSILRVIQKKINNKESEIYE